MTMSAARTAAPAFSAGRVFGRAAALIRSRGFVIAIGALLFLATLESASNWAVSTLDLHVLRHNRIPLGDSSLSLLQSVIVMVSEGMVTAWITLLLIGDQIAGDRFDPLAAARQVVTKVGPVTVLVLIFAAGFIGAMLLLVVPALILATAWCVGVPAMVAEDLSPRAAIARSLTLTRGRRWSIFGLMLLPLGIGTLTNVVIMRLFRGGASALVASKTPLLRFAVLPVLHSLEHAVIAALIASIYVELVTLKEGSLKAGIAEVFG